MKLDIDIEEVIWHIENCFEIVKESNYTNYNQMTQLIFWKSVKELIQQGAKCQ